MRSEPLVVTFPFNFNLENNCGPAIISDWYKGEIINEHGISVTGSVPFVIRGWGRGLMTNLWRLSIWNYQHSKKKCVNSNKDPLSTCKSKYQTLQALIHKQHHTITKNNKYFLKNSAGFYKIPKSRRHLVVHINRGCNSALRINGVDHYAVRINGVIVLVSLYARINWLDHLYGRRIYIYGLQHIYPQSILFIKRHLIISEFI